MHAHFQNLRIQLEQFSSTDSFKKLYKEKGGKYMPHIEMVPMAVQQYVRYIISNKLDILFRLSTFIDYIPVERIMARVQTGIFYFGKPNLNSL